MLQGIGGGGGGGRCSVTSVGSYTTLIAASLDIHAGKLPDPDMHVMDNPDSSQWRLLPS